MNTLKHVLLLTIVISVAGLFSIAALKGTKRFSEFQIKSNDSLNAELLDAELRQSWANQLRRDEKEESMWLLYLYSGKAWDDAKLINTVGVKLAGIINKASAVSGVNRWLLVAIIKNESDFDQFAESKVGACGYTQLMPGTAKSLGVTKIFDPEENIVAGAKYFAKMYKRFGSLEMALAAYNWGPTNLASLGRMPNRKGVKHYVKKVLDYYEDYRS